ncbi:MAG: tandem-95 repeat protein, partial [Verrucomicrobia bacterium]|nr:tandem-95 repeat protein [Verrucomicrobiota bacterium]
PDANYHGPDSFSYHANDGTTNSGIATVTLTVLAVNNPPVALNDAYNVTEDTALNIIAPGVLGNDSDPDGDLLTAILVTDPMHGTLALNTNGSFTYTPNPNYSGPDLFSYHANDGTTNSGIASVTLTVIAVNDPPVAQNDQYSLLEDTLLTIPVPGVLTNDSDLDGDTLSAILVTLPGHGQLTLNPDGSFTYAPVTNFNGMDSFSYRASDGQTNSGIATVTLLVTPVNDTLDTNNWTGSSFTVLEDATLNVAMPGVLAGIVDADGDALSITQVSATSNGVLNLNSDGSFSYTPNTNYNGPDNFQFRVSDGTTNTGLLTASITVLPVNDEPSFVKGGNQRIQQNAGAQSVPAWATGITPGPDNESNQTVTFIVTNDNGALFVVPPAVTTGGTLAYTPATNVNGTATVTIRAHDDGGVANGGVDTSSPQTFSITVNAPPTVSIVSPTNGASFFAPGNFALLADAQDSDGTVVKVEFFSATNMIGEATSGTPFFTVMTNLPVGTYKLGARATDDFGATGSAIPVTVSVIERPPLTLLTSVYYNPQKDFFEQRVRITNPTYSTLDAVRVLVFNLTNTPAITVRNRTGFTNDIPYVQTHAAVPPGSFVDLTIEFASPLRIQPNPILRAELVQPAGPVAPLQGTFQHVNRGLLLANRTFLIEFPTLTNRVYSIQYSKDLIHWKTSSPAITGDGNWVQWIDNGEPKTDGPPAAAQARFYRLILLP